MKIQVIIKYLPKGDEPTVPDDVIDFDQYEMSDSRVLHLERAPNGDAVRIIPGDATFVLKGTTFAPPLPQAAPGNIWQQF